MSARRTRGQHRITARTESAERLTPLEASILMLLAVALVCAALSGPAQASVEDLSTITIRVRPADTLWNLAAHYRVDGLGTAETVQLIRDLNGMNDARLSAGTTLVVPAHDDVAALAALN